MAKHKKARHIGLVLTITGAACMVTGLVMVLIDFNENGFDESGAVGIIGAGLFFGGAVTGIVSIPFYAVGHSNANKAKAIVYAENKVSIGEHIRLPQSQSVGVRFGFYPLFV